MQPGRALVFIGLLTVSVSSGNAETQDETSLTIGADLEYRSRYLFSGVPFSTDSVMQARLALGYSGFTFNALTNYDFELTDGGQIARLTLSHEVPAGTVTIIGTGNIVYDDNYYRVGSNFSHLDLSISIKAQLGRFTVTPMVT